MKGRMFLKGTSFCFEGLLRIMALFTSDISLSRWDVGAAGSAALTAWFVMAPAPSQDSCHIWLEAGLLL